MKSLILILLFVSCTKEVELEVKNSSYFVGEVESSLEDYKHYEWNVGLQRQNVVSQGVAIKVRAPKVSSDNQDILYQKHGIDSWIYKIVKISSNGKYPISFIDIPFRNPLSKTAKNFTVHLNYPASWSQKHRRFKCPAFGHRKLVRNIDFNKESFSLNAFNASYSRSFNGKLDNINSFPLTINAGVSLEGTYYVELALYSSKHDRLHGSWQRLPGSISIEREREVKVPSCLGIKEEINPLPSSQGHDIRNLEIK